jgi:hypothetical protein
MMRMSQGEEDAKQEKAINEQLILTCDPVTQGVDVGVDAEAANVKMLVAEAVQAITCVIVVVVTIPVSLIDRTHLTSLPSHTNSIFLDHYPQHHLLLLELRDKSLTKRCLVLR